MVTLASVSKVGINENVYPFEFQDKSTEWNSETSGLLFVGASEARARAAWRALIAAWR